MRQKLTVRLPPENLEFLKRYAAAHQITATEVIDRYLRRLRLQSVEGVHPDVERFSGIVPESVDVEREWYEHEIEKHR